MPPVCTSYDIRIINPDYNRHVEGGCKFNIKWYESAFAVERNGCDYIKIMIHALLNLWAHLWNSATVSEM